MKKQKRLLIVSGICFALGIVLQVYARGGIGRPHWRYLDHMGLMLITVGGTRFGYYLNYITDKDYRERMEIAETDERNHFLRNKAWAWAGYLFVFIAVIASVVLYFMGEEQLSTVTEMGLCLLLVLYYVSYWVLSKKY